MVARGIRNNNPLNIRKGNDWKGERQPQTDRAFEEFTSIEFGLRAGFIIVRNYLKRRIDTPRSIVSTWAPTNENPTQRYVDFVCKKASLDPARRLQWTEKNALCRLLWAMAEFECGTEIPFNRFEYAYELASR